MKKAVVLGMILLALGTLAYAADASVSFGFARSTFTVASGEMGSGSSKDIISGWGLFDYPSAPRETFGLAYSGEHAAFNFTGYFIGTDLSWVGIYGTLKLMPDMFSVLVGEFNNDGWDTFRKTSPHPIHDVNNGNVGRFNGYGIILDVAPKDSGFEGAVMVKTDDPTAAGAPATIEETFTNTNIGFAYTVPNTLKIVAGSTSELWDPVKGPFPNRAHRDIFGRVELLMVPNLTAWADVKYDGFDLATKVSNINAELAGAYDMKPLTIVFAGTVGSNDVLGTKTMTWAVYPEVYYNMGAFTLGLYASVGGSDVKDSGIGYGFEPYVVINDFNTRISFHYTGNSASGSISTWEIPIMIDWGI